MGDEPQQFSNSDIQGAISRVTSCQYVSDDTCIAAIAQAAVGILRDDQNDVSRVLDANFGPGSDWARAKQYVKG